MKLNHCYHGDCRDVIRQLLDQGGGGKVQTIVTSPPYWNLRDYGVSGQIGMEPTLQEFVSTMVEVFALCRELLADDGTLWLNLGDSYSANHGSGSVSPGKKQSTSPGSLINDRREPRQSGLKPKDLCGVPWRVAFALQDAGWYLRQDIIWSKPNPMPESVRDRCTKAHEYLFLLTKSPRYYFDFDAFQEPVSGTANARTARYKTPDGWDTSTGEGGHGGFHREGREKGKYPGNGVGFGHGSDKQKRNRDRVSEGVGHRQGPPNNPAPVGVGPKASAPGSGVKYNESFSSAVVGLVDTRNRRSVWTIATQSYSEAHFATFPEALVEPCILAGSRPGDIVFDPFMGSGTVAQVAQNLGRKWIGSELNPEYIALQAGRTRQAGFEFAA